MAWPPHAAFDMQELAIFQQRAMVSRQSGQTLFLPANMTHKVVTLESYIGVGGFYLALPNCLRLLRIGSSGAALVETGSHGSNDKLVGEIAESVGDGHSGARRATPKSARRWVTTIWSRRRPSSRPVLRLASQPLVESASDCRRGHSCTLAALARRQPGIRALRDEGNDLSGFDRLEAQLRIFSDGSSVVHRDLLARFSMSRMALKI